MKALIGKFFQLMPFWFGAGFLAPAIAELIEKMGWVPPLGLHPVVIGLLIGAPWGAFATWKGRWI